MFKGTYAARWYLSCCMISGGPTTVNSSTSLSIPAPLSSLLHQLNCPAGINRKELVSRNSSVTRSWTNDSRSNREYQRLYKNSSSRMCNWYQRHVVIIFIIYSPILDHISSCWREDFRSFVEFYDNFSRRPQSLISTRLRAPCGLRAPWRSFNLRDHWIGVVVVGLS